MTDDPADLLALHAQSVVTQCPDGQFEVAVEGSAGAFRVSEPTLALLSLFDGTRTEEEVRSRAAERGLRVTESALRSMTRGLAAAGILVRCDLLPIITLPESDVHCTGCGICCHLAVGPLTDRDVQKVLALDWASVGVEPPETCFRADATSGEPYLAQTPAEVCVFLDPDGLCRIHRHFGIAAKPDPCQLFPLIPVRHDERIRVGLTYETRGLWNAEAHGSPMAEHAAAMSPVIRRVAAALPVSPRGSAISALSADARAAERPSDVLRLLEASAEARVGEGALGLDDLLGDLEAMAADAAQRAPSDSLRAATELTRGALAALVASPAAEGPTPAWDHAPLDAFYLGYLRNQLFLGTHMGRLGTPAGSLLLAVTLLVGTRLASAEAIAADRPSVTGDDAAVGLAGALTGLRFLDQIGEIEGIGARALREAAARMP